MVQSLEMGGIMGIMGYIIIALAISQTVSIFFLVKYYLKIKSYESKFKTQKDILTCEILGDIHEYGYTLMKISPDQVYLRSIKN